MDIHLSPETEKLVQNRLKAGQYSSADDVVRAALFMMAQQEAHFELDIEDARAKIEAGLKSLREGKGVDGEEVFARLEAELDAWDHSEQQK